MKNRNKAGLSLLVVKTPQRIVKISSLRFVCHPNAVILKNQESKERRNPITIDWGDYSPGEKKKILVKSIKDFRVIREGIVRYNDGVVKGGGHNGKQRKNQPGKLSRKMP